MSPDLFPNHATPPGSAAYYLCRFSPAASRSDLALLFAWFAEMERLRTIPDPGVARTKLNWWRDEIHRSRAGTAQHPLARAIGGLMARHAVEPSGLDRIGAEMDRHFLAGGFVSRDLLRAHHRATGGAFARLLILATGHPVTRDDAVRDAGAFYTAVDVLCRLGAELAAFAPRIDKTALAALRESSSTREDTEPLVATLCEDALALRPQKVGDLPVPARGLARLADARLREISRAGAVVLDKGVDLTPIRKLWTVWRAA